MSNVPNIIQAMEGVFAKSFPKKGTDSWKAWRCFLKAVFALPMDAEERSTYQRYTGRDAISSEQFREAFCIVGRRGGKSVVSAFIATYLATFRDYSAVLGRGELGIVMLLAADKRQARVVLGYINGFFAAIPMLAHMIESRTQESITLTNSIRIEVHTASFRAVRGYTIVGVVCDEIAFWPNDESANPDVEVLNALRPAMSTIPNALLLCISSPYARRGALWEAHREYFGKSDASVLVWQAETRAMNPSVSRAVIAAAYLRDHAAASAEYGAQFRSDVEGFVSLEVVEGCVVRNRFELPPLSDVSYRAFVDPSGGSSDAMTLAIAHKERDRAVLDLLCEKLAPFSPESVVQEFSDILKRYRISAVTGDRYAGQWPREQFVKRGIDYRPAEKTRSELYLELLPALNSGQVELLDNKRLISQLQNLERHTSRLGRDSVDHAPGGHDDLANVCAGVLVEVSGKTLRLGLVELILEESEKRILPANNDPARVANTLTCPKCSWSGIARRGPLGHCSRCGHEFRLEPVEKCIGITSRHDLEITDSVNRNLTPNRFSH